VTGFYEIAAHLRGRYQVSLFVSREPEAAEAFSGLMALIRREEIEAGRIDVLVYSAGVSGDGLVTDVAESVYDECMDVNLKGAWLATQAAAARTPEGLKQLTELNRALSSNPEAAAAAVATQAAASLGARSVARCAAARAASISPWRRRSAAVCWSINCTARWACRSARWPWCHRISCPRTRAPRP